MSKNVKDICEKQLLKRRNYTISCFNEIVTKATKSILYVDEELRQLVAELYEETEKNSNDFYIELEKQLKEIEKIREQSEKEEGLNKKFLEQEAMDLTKNVLDHIDFVISRAERNVNNVERSLIDSRKQINRIVDETLENISRIWLNTRDQMEFIYSKATDIIGVRLGVFEDMIGLLELKMKEIQQPLLDLAESLIEEHTNLVDDLMITLQTENEKLVQTRTEEIEKFEEYEKMKAEKEALEAKNNAKKKSVAPETEC